MTGADQPHPDLQPGDERNALVQRLDQYRAIGAAALVDVTAHPDTGSAAAMSLSRG